MPKPDKEEYEASVFFKCYGCGNQCSAGYNDKDEPRIIHPMPPCEAFMLDQPGEEYLRKCREGN